MDESRAIDAVLCDRDGTLVVDVPYNGDPARVEPLPGSGRRAWPASGPPGSRLAVVSNQSGVARGLLTAAQVERASTPGLVDLLGPFDAVLWCPHGPDDGCACRKPAPGMVLAAADGCGVAGRPVCGDRRHRRRRRGGSAARGTADPRADRACTRADEVAAAPCVVPDFAAPSTWCSDVGARPLSGRPGFRHDRRRPRRPARQRRRRAARRARGAGRRRHRPARSTCCADRGAGPAADLLPGVDEIVELARAVDRARADGGRPDATPTLSWRGSVPAGSSDAADPRLVAPEPAAAGAPVALGGRGTHRRRQPRPRRVAARRAASRATPTCTRCVAACSSPRRSASPRPSTTAWPSTSPAPGRRSTCSPRCARRRPTSSSTPEPRVPARTLSLDAVA